MYLNKLYVDTYTFADMEIDKNIDIKFSMNDETEITFKCEYIGLDVVEKPITKKLPLIISASGYSTKGYKAYEEKRKIEYIGLDSFERIMLPNIIYGDFIRQEEVDLKNAIKRFQVLYSSYKEDYYHEI